MVLVSLLGIHDSSIYPILMEYKDKISKHIIIHDDSRYETNMLLKVLEAQNKFKEFYSIDYQINTIKIDEDCYDSIIKCYEKIVSLANNDFENIYFNATDGLVSSTIILSDKLLNKGAKFFAYDIFDNGYNIVTKNSLEKKHIKNNKDILTHFILKGYEMLSMGSKIEAYGRKDIVMEICEDLDKYQDFAFSVQNRNYYDIDGFTEIKSLLKQIDKIEDTMYIQGTLFEEYIYWLIVDNFDFDHVMFNVKVEFRPMLQNEFDILMMKDNHLHVIECKLRKSIPGEDYVYKLDSLIDYLDDDGKGMILLVGAENERVTNQGKTKKSFTQGTKIRAKNAQIKLHHAKSFDKNSFLEDIRKHFLN
ncbi:Card1-like endonuclease domain-containing protein [Arcobacter porcinus]|uniref:DUF1887 domain-containing protein n=1 Tax=Arcobacter porcinus TaxID=1935204 RepID=A0A5C2HJ67_9BACT|nr:DUF1887 family CARF protein [Arcobacter porcinus]OCL85431.1 hypothetical protein AAX30_01933 [Arcobacter porcinus]OCL90632.1 hypothetical protein AAX27_01441 [Aliarcobacter thereius]QEP40790.1 DUF1887 domain-containing protein [Arcobacter porcinus]